MANDIEPCFTAFQKRTQVLPCNTITSKKMFDEFKLPNFILLSAADAVLNPCEGLQPKNTKIINTSTSTHDTHTHTRV